MGFFKITTLNTTAKGGGAKLAFSLDKLINILLINKKGKLK